VIEKSEVLLRGIFGYLKRKFALHIFTKYLEIAEQVSLGVL